MKNVKSFIDGLGEGGVNGTIVRLIVDFAHTLGLEATTQRVSGGARADEPFVAGA